MVRTTPPILSGPTTSREEIRAFVNDVVEKFHPLRVILFGSYAYGEPNADSDVDLLVVMRHRDASPKVAARIQLACPHRFPLDILVRSPAELRRRIEMGDIFFHEVTSKGAVLHEADNGRMGR